VADDPQAPSLADEARGDGEDATAGERHAQDAYDDFRRALEALPNAAAFQALVTEYGRQFGFRTVGRWVAGRAPRPPKSSPARGDGADQGA
jgi:hypothetical protein